MNQNTGHGHVFPRPDGVKARCGGPAFCKECAADLAQQADSWPCSKCGVQRSHFPACAQDGCPLMLAASPAASPAKQAPGCARSHPHENMSAACEAATVEARAVNAAAQQAQIDHAVITTGEAWVMPDGRVLNALDVRAHPPAQGVGLPPPPAKFPPIWVAEAGAYKDFSIFIREHLENRDDEWRAAIAKAPAAEPAKLWLWKNFVDGRPEYWAFDNAFPVFMDSDDPQTLGEPCGYALFKPSRQGRMDLPEAEVLRRVKAALEPWQKVALRLVSWQHCMSYNDSYFGEPAGYLKQCVNELRHLLPPAPLAAASNP